jgi:hypothetical protein
MTFTDIIIKILLFFLVFYGAILISSYISKKIRRFQNRKKSRESNEQTT